MPRIEDTRDTEPFGASRIVKLIVRVRDDGLEVAADMTLPPEKDAGELVASTDTELAGSAPAAPMPESIVRYVARTQERVVLDDAAADPGRFA